ncbi:MAG: glycosyl hydrolase [Ignavibacteria bacterium]|nr:glycosyl hydrolase [Ignavibacteria bacterium]
MGSYFYYYFLLIIFIVSTPIFSQKWTGAIEFELGKEEVVFNYDTDRCVEYDLPDVYAHAIRTEDSIALVSDISFTITDSVAYLYFMRNMDNHSKCGWGFKKNLVREPIKIKKVNKEKSNLSLLEPEDGKVYHGACLMTYESGSDPLGPYLKALKDSTIHPAVRSYFMTIPGERGPENGLKGLKQFFKNADSIGFIPELSLFFIGKDVSTDSIIAVSNIYDRIIDSIITICKDYGKSMFLRIGGEFNGAGPGWNGGGYHPYYYVKMFKKIVDKYRERGFRDSIATVWCYEPDAPNDFDSVDSRGARWYPGDEYVDWFGLDVFDVNHFDQMLPNYDRRGITKKGKTERFLAFAREKGKPVYINETTAKGINISPDSLDGVEDWKNWFEKFFELIDKHIEIKGFNYINAKWPESAYPNWGDARIQNNQYILNKYIEELKKSKYVHLKRIKITKQDTIPLTELGLDKWKGFEGGLYPNGINQRPIKHNMDGINLAQSIIPLDTMGNPSPNGKIVLLSIGMSNCTQEFQVFKRIADTFSLKNPYLTIVDGAQGGQTASIISNPDANFWNVVKQRLATAGVSEKQVQVVWLKEANANPKEDFPEHALILKEQLKKIVQILKQKFPNIKLTYISSRTYGGYATTTLNPEPYAYETGFSVKWLIEDQINGDTLLSYKGKETKAPWLAWGPYLWAKGTTPRSDGLIWERDDFGSDGTHPSDKGRLKVANLLLKFFSTDETATPWFLRKTSSIYTPEGKENISIHPNPCQDFVKISFKGKMDESLNRDVSIFDVLGNEIFCLKGNNTEQIHIDVSNFNSGIFFVKIGNIFKSFIVFHSN